MRRPKKYLLLRVDNPEVRIIAWGYLSVRLVTGFNNATISKLLQTGGAKDFWMIDED